MKGGENLKMSGLLQIEPEKINVLSEESLMEAHEKAIYLMEEIEATVLAIREELKARLEAEGVKGKVIGNYSVTKANRISFKTTIDQARELGAIVTKESIDTKVLRSLYDSGVEVEGAEQTSYLLIKPVEKGGEE